MSNIDQKHDEKKTERRRDEALKRALQMPPKPHKVQAEAATMMFHSDLKPLEDALNELHGPLTDESLREQLRELIGGDPVSMAESLDKIVTLQSGPHPTLGAGHTLVRFEPTDSFVDFVRAFRAKKPD